MIALVAGISVAISLAVLFAVPLSCRTYCGPWAALLCLRLTMHC